MINIEQVSKKLNALFNGTDIENGNNISPNHDKYFFNVATAGFELKEIFDMETGKNFIPVFVSSLGGTFNPIPNLKEFECNYQVEIFFPVRFKEDFYGTFTSFLLDNLVSKVLTFEGEQRGLVNVGVPQYGEIQTASVREFQNFIVNTYKMPITVSEQWMSMTFTLFVKGSDLSGYMFGNDVDIQLGYKNYNNIEIIKDSASINYGASTENEQILGTKTSKAIATTSADSYSLTLNVVKNNPGLTALIRDMLNGILQNNQITLKMHFLPFQASIDCIVTNISMPIVLGSSIKLTMTFTRKIN